MRFSSLDTVAVVSGASPQINWMCVWCNVVVLCEKQLQSYAFWPKAAFSCSDMVQLEDGKVLHVPFKQTRAMEEMHSTRMYLCELWSISSSPTFTSFALLQSLWLQSVGVTVLMRVEVTVAEVWGSTPVGTQRLSTLQRNSITREIQSMINGIVGKVHVKVWGAVQMSKVGGRRKERGEVKNIITVY